ncbi:MAG: TlpA family protein disulfide reductase [Gemmatimonadetes bacterium]|nr:TlpA family protein disulfide reductase [Gemmatimonadota bacterium]MYE69739.1 TlpA family protein disulfide reductase [Gemmatimonadota bacterium]MYJ69859.1 TlpA family protein disulfide reductase [Gemmatimonadota bacterium]
MRGRLGKRAAWGGTLMMTLAACSARTETGSVSIDRSSEPAGDSLPQAVESALGDFVDLFTGGGTIDLEALTAGGTIDLDALKHPPESLLPGKVAPNIVGEDTDGVEFELEDYRGNIVVLIFSGEWCGPCREEYPYQRQMLERYDGTNVVLLGVNSDPKLETIQEAKEREGLHYRTWWDKSPFGPINRAWVSSWPSIFILDEEGIILHDDKRGEEIIKAVDELLETRRTQPPDQPDSAAESADPFVPPAELADAELDRRLASLDSLLLIPMNAYDIHDKGRNHIRTFTRSLQKTLLTPVQTERVAGYMDELLERHPEARRMITRQQFLVENLTPGKVSPNIAGKDLDGVEFELADYRGNIVVLFFTGEWCGPCRAEYPHQRQMLERHEDDDVVLLGVNSDGELDRVLEAKEREGLHYRTWWDESTRGPIAQSWIVWSWPTTYILDADGVIRYVDLRGDAILQGVNELLAEEPRLVGGR